MPRITRLPDSVANKISAGEVVQRPASVVKELIENAIDAGAGRIVLSIKDAGKQLVQVIDNGHGMSEPDALMCVERFATSKISSAEELMDLGTLGFRGEALASISSVSHFELKSRPEGADAALLLRYEGGELAEKSRAAADRGTTISVRNLFYNVPARRKFLKTNATEFRHIFDTVKAQVLAYPEVQWQLFNDDEELFHFRSSDMHERLNFFFGEAFADSLIEIREENDFLSLYGYIGKPGMLKRQKNDQLFYINRRVIQNRMLAQALQQAYGELLVDRQIPFALLFLGLDTRQIDINVHPAKLEVRFEDERNVRNMVYPIVKRAVQLQDFAPDVGAAGLVERQMTREELNPERALRKLEYKRPSGPPSSTGDLYRSYLSELPSIPSSAVAQGSIGEQGEMFSDLLAPSRDHDRELKASEYDRSALLQSDENRPDPGGSDSKIWQLHNKYIVCQIKTGLMVIDQHVAHERVLYERAIEIMNNNVPNSQQLLFPQKVELKSWEYEIFEEIRDDLGRLGFNLRSFGNRTVMIEGIAQDVRNGTEAMILQNMIDEYQQNAVKLKLEKRENIAKSYSCRNAIMSGQKLGLEEMRSLIDRLFATSMPYVCPHGRPVIIKISLDQLDRMFGRK